MTENTLPRRVGAYVAGLFMMAMGVCFAVKSRLGISPVNAIPYVLSLTTGKDQGLMITLVFGCFVLLQLLLLKELPRLENLFQMLCVSMFGYFVSLCQYILAFPEPSAYPARMALLLISIVLIAAGLLLYLSARLPPQPAEGLCLAIERLTRWKYHHIKTGFDCVLVAIAAVISFMCSGSILGLREGTLIAMLGVGPALGLFTRLLGARLTAFCFPAASGDRH